MPLTKGDVYLVVDTRERHVKPLIEGAFGREGRSFASAQIHTGDYLICRKYEGGEPEILACIERKSLKDFAASIRDRRVENRNKMIDLRGRTGCQLYFFVEGRAFAKPGWSVGHVPFSTITAAETNLMVRDGIGVVKVADEAHTAQRLLEFVGRFEMVEAPFRFAGTTTGRGGEIAWEVGPSGGADGPPAAQSSPAVAPSVLQVPKGLTGRIERPDDEILLDLWCSLPGVSQVTACVVRREFSVAELVGGRVASDCIQGLRTPANRILGQQARDSLQALKAGDKNFETKVLGAVPGLSQATARTLLEGRSLRSLLGLDRKELAALQIPQRNRKVKLGGVKAERIDKLLRMWGEPAPAVAQKEGGPAPEGAAPPTPAGPEAAEQAPTSEPPEPVDPALGEDVEAFLGGFLGP